MLKSNGWGRSLLPESVKNSRPCLDIGVRNNDLMDATGTTTVQQHPDRNSILGVDLSVERQTQIRGPLSRFCK